MNLDPGERGFNGNKGDPGKLTEFSWSTICI